MLFTNMRLYKQLDEHKLDKLLREVPHLDMRERDYVRGLLTSYHSGGISKQDVGKAVRELKRNTSDRVEKHEADAIEKHLMDYLNN